MEGKLKLLEGLPGTGKTSYVLEKAKRSKVLFLSMNKILIEQTEERAKKEGVEFEILTFAKLDLIFKSNYAGDYDTFKVLYLSAFDIIFIDEVHSLFTYEEIIDYKVLIKHIIFDNKDRVILMSATMLVVYIFQMSIERVKGNPLKNYDENLLISKLNDGDPAIPIKKVSVFNKRDEIKTRALKLSKKGKILYLVEKVKDAESLKSYFVNNLVSSDSIALLSGKNTDNGKRIMSDTKNQETYNSIVQKQKYPENINVVITTKANREGVSIIDDEVKYVICEIPNMADIVQIAGRLRNGVDELVVYTGKLNKASLDAYFNLIPEMLSDVDELNEFMLNCRDNNKIRLRETIPKYKFNYKLPKKIKDIIYNEIEKKFEINNFGLANWVLELYSNQQLNYDPINFLNRWLKIDKGKIHFYDARYKFKLLIEVIRENVFEFNGQKLFRYKDVKDGVSQIYSDCKRAKVLKRILDKHGVKVDLVEQMKINKMNTRSVFLVLDATSIFQ